MKKYLALILGVFFVFAFAASALAVDVTLTGEVTHWNWYRDNIGGYDYTEWLDLNSDGLVDSNEPVVDKYSYPLPVSRRYSEKFDQWNWNWYSTDEDSRSSAFSMTRVRLGADIKVSDNLKGMIELESNGTTEKDFYTWGTLNDKQSSVSFRQAWIQYTGSGLLGIPAGIKMGHMPLILGLGKFLNNTRYGDDAILLFADPNKQLHIGLLTFKAYEGDIYDNTDDIDAYGALMTYKIDDKSNFGINYVRINDPDKNIPLQQFQNIMLHGSTDVAGLSIKAEIDYQFGKLDKATTPETKAAGYLLFAELGYKVDPVGIRASYANGSGDKPETADKDEGFINFLGPDENVAFIYEYQIMSASGGDNTSGLTNTTMYNVGLDFSPMKDMSLALDGYLFRANKLDAGMSKKVGTEVDLKAKYNVTKGLTWTILAGCFTPGKFYQDVIDDFAGPGWAEKKTVTAVRSELTLSF